MGWVQVDDFTDERIDPEVGAHRLTVCLDGDEIRGWDVSAGSTPEDVLASLGEHLSGLAAPLVSQPAPPSSEPSSEPSAARYECGHGCGPDALNGACPEHGAQHEVQADIEGDDPADDEVVDDAGQPERAATDAEVRAWCARWGVPCSTTGKLNRSAREAYERVGGGQPDAQTVRDRPEPTVNGHQLPAEPAQPAEPPSPPPSPPPAEPAVEPAGDGSRPRPEQLDLAREMAADLATPKAIVERTGISLEDARQIVDEARRARR